MRIAVICALEYEISELTQHMEDVSCDQICGVEVTEGFMGEHSLFIALSGEGKTCAAATTQAVISEYMPDAVISIGLAGCCSSELPVGGAVIATGLVFHDVDISISCAGKISGQSFAADPAIRALARQIIRDMGIPCIEGIIATGDRFVDNSELKADIIRRTGCACVDMDSAAVAYVCQRNSVPLVSVRVMSDSANENAPEEYAFSAVKYCELSAEIIRRICRSLSA